MGIDVENGKVFSMAIVDEDGTVECMTQLKDISLFNEAVKVAKTKWPIEMVYSFLNPNVTKATQ